MDEPPGTRLRVALSALTMAEYFRDVQHQDTQMKIGLDGWGFWQQIAFIAKIPNPYFCSEGLTSELSIVR